jgi:hypothetical protein
VKGSDILSRKEKDGKNNFLGVGDLWTHPIIHLFNMNVYFVPNVAPGK